MAKREAPEINAGSMADIAFLLLIFFLVTTTMDIDTGITRKLPPMPPEEESEKPPPIKQKNIFTVLINANDQLLVEGKQMEPENIRESAIEFIDNNGDKSCEYCQGENDPKSSDNPYKAVISLQNDRGTSYETYILVQNELVAAYNDLRKKYSRRYFGKEYDDISDERQKEIKKLYPMKISEAEPVNVNK